MAPPTDTELTEEQLDKVAGGLTVRKRGETPIDY
jgi:hypothetical protein